jgi:pSer/pThr/pTyr-binding forkhead associated (FHA) protein
MPSQVTLTVTEGRFKGQEVVFIERTTCLVGRGDDCNLQLPDDENHRTISRYHCLLDINPPNARIRDFGSLNGTYVNGKKIGQRESHQSREEAIKIKFPEYDLQDNDEIRLSHTVFQVSIERENHIYSPTINYAGRNPLENPDLSSYTILKELGKGGFGAVYLARQDATGKEVALKILLPQVIATEGVVERFMREIENTKALRHPNVVRLEDAGYWEQTFFFTLEYCNGGSVIDLMEQQGQPLPIPLALNIILQVLDGLAYTHNAEIPYVKCADGSFTKGRGLVHRDIKPGNIFLVKEGKGYIAKIGDYGLAKAFDVAGLSGQTLTGSVAGTPIFMPRQQVIDFKYAQPDVDVWATAACLYYMLTGYFPRDLQGKDPLLAILQNSPIPIQQRNAKIPLPLAKVIDLALIDKPEIHFKTAIDLKQALLSAS